MSQETLGVSYKPEETLGFGTFISHPYPFSYQPFTQGPFTRSPLAASCFTSGQVELVISCRSRARNTAAWSALWCCSSDLSFAYQRREDERMDLGWFPLFFHIFTAKNGMESSKVYIQYMWQCTSSPLAQGRQMVVSFYILRYLKGKGIGQILWGLPTP